jgi:hypothetical protein
MKLRIAIKVVHNQWPQRKHVNYIRLQGDRNNNNIERMNGKIRDREKTLRFRISKCQS